jgi:hypothetical protein
MLLCLLLSFVALTAHAQSVPQATQHGLIVDDQGAYVFETSGAAARPDPCMNQRELTLLQRLAESAPNAGFRVPVASATPCVEFEAWIEPLPENYTQTVSGGLAGIERGEAKTTIHRFVRDNARRVYVSYAVAIESLAEAGAYRVSLGSSAAPSLPGDWQTVAPAHPPVPQIMRDGDELPVELYAAGPNGIRFMDYLRVGRRDKMAQRKEAPRDSYAEDAEFTLAQPRLSVNGMVQASVSLPETIRGGVVWIYVPANGRYVLAFAPHDDRGFKPAGETGGSSMTLVVDGTVLRIACADRIAAGGGIYKVYALRDASWQPADPSDRDRFLLGSSPGIDTAVGR